MYNTIAISSIYAHPLEFIVGNAIPTFIGVFIFKSKAHVVSYFGWYMFRFIDTHEGHSGFEFPISAFGAHPFNIDTRYHDFHHLKNIGNYASFTTIWDSLFGTNVVYDQYLDELKAKGKAKLE